MNIETLLTSLYNTIITWLVLNFKFIFVSVMVFLLPIKPLLLSVGFLIACDFIIGLYKSYKLGEDITSRKMGHSISKIFLYTLAVVVLHVFETYVLQSGLPLPKMASILICLVELKSIDEHIKLLTGLSLYDKLFKMIKRGSSETKDLLEEE